MAAATGTDSLGLFSRLRQICILVEKEMPKLQEAVNYPQHAQRDSLDAEEAARLLQDVNKDVRQLKSEMKTLQQSMSQDLDIIALMQAGKTLLEVQKQRVANVENHMQKYGYTPLSLKQETEVCGQREGVEEMAQESAVPATPSPARQPARPRSSGECTPTMEGFDPDILQKVAKVREAVCVQSKVRELEFKKPNQHANVPLLPPTPAEFRRDSAEVPEAFEHQGMYMTPGIFNGKALPDETPAKMQGGALQRSHYVDTDHKRFETPMELPRPVSSSRIGPIAMMGLDADDTVSSGGDISQPSLDMSNMNSVSKPPAFYSKAPAKSRNSLDSPVAPEMTEDLRKMLYRFVPTSSVAASAAGKPPGGQCENNSPVPPSFLTKSALSTSPGSMDNSPIPPDFLLKSGTHVPGTSSSEPSPIPPDFLRKPGDLTGPASATSVSRVLHQIQHPEEHDVGPAPELRRVSIEEQELPQMPTLDVLTLPGLNSKLLAKLTGPVQLEDPLVAKHSAPKQANNCYKENVPPTPRSRPLDEMTTIVDMVSEWEFQSRPIYLKNQFTLDTVNQMVEKINRILLNKIADGIELELREADLHSDLGKSTQAFFLLMNIMGRLKQTRVNGQIVYRIP